MAMMKLARIHAFGGSDTLAFDEVPVPEPESDEVLVHIQAAGINPVDFKIREGDYPVVDASDLPVGMGRDVSGTVQRTGHAVQAFHEGDAVFAMAATGRGTYGEYVAVRADQLAAKPEQLDHVHAAAVPLAALTAWQGLFDHGHLRRGQRVLIHGASGGVGHFAVQFAHQAGAHVIASARAEDIRFLRGLGADECIDYRHQAFEDIVEDVDLVYDLIGGQTQQRSFQVLAAGGMLVSTLEPPSQDEAGKHHVRATRYTVQPNARQLAHIARLIDQGALQVVVQKTFDLIQAAAAQDYLESEHIRGKLVLKAA